MRNSGKTSQNKEPVWEKLDQWRGEQTSLEDELVLVKEDRCTCIGRKEKKERGGAWRDGRDAPSVTVASLSSPHRSSGGFPVNPAVLNKGQSSTRHSSKTCSFSALP